MSQGSWSAEPPIEPGWYYAVTPHDNGVKLTPVAVFLDPEGGVGDAWNQCFTVADYALWSPRLPDPPGGLN